MKKRNLWIALVAVLAVLICAGVCLGLILHREHFLDEAQKDALQEIEDHRGEYDEKSIVLYDTNRGEAQALAEKFDADLRISHDGKFATLTLRGDVTVEDIYAARGNRKYISDMALDYQVKTSELTEEEAPDGERLPTRPQYTVSDSDYELQAYLDYLNMGKVWNTTRGGGITVAVIDTGIDTDHPEFVGRISEYSYNATEDKIVKDYLLEDGSYDWSLVEDEQGHGTAVTGVIAASMNSGNVVGLAPEVTIIAIKAECNENGTFARTSDLVFGLYYAIERDVAVVNMSFGVQSPNNPFAEATQLAYDSDIICVAGSGNEASTALTYPAADENVFGVGALEADGWNLASYSNYGENVNLVAPGTTYTTLMGGTYGNKSGTSLAAPTVTGAIALYLSVNRYQEFNTVEEVLYASCYDLGDLGCDWYYGYGALDVSALILEERGTVTFNMMTDELENTEQLFIRNHTLQNMPEPERLYAIFDGWYYDPQCTEEYNWYADEFSADLTLYANWVNEEDGIPYTYVELEDGTIEIRSYTGHRRYITIPDTIDGKVVSSIGEEAFMGESRLREVILPKQLKYVRRSAFEGCNNLLHIDIPDTVVLIGDSAFYNNVRLSYVAFGANSQLTSVGSNAFANCSKLQRFELPAKLTSLDGSAFFGATNLTAFSVRAGNPAFVAKDGVLFNYTASTLVCYPAGLRGEYTVPNTVRIIGGYAFGYARITQIGLSNVESIGERAFAVSALETVVIPDSVISMGTEAFASCFYLKSVQLGNGLTSISGGAFDNCFMLSTIEIPANIRTIDGKSFCNTTSLATVTFAKNSRLTQIGESAFSGSGLQTIAIPASVITVWNSAFAYTQLSSVTFPEGSQLRVIGECAFTGDGLLTQIQLPNQLEQIGACAFMNTGLQTVSIPASVTYLGEGVFAACHSLTDIAVEDGNAVYVDVVGVVYDKAITTLVAYPAGNARTAYSVQSGVTAIGESAFYGSWNLNTVTLPEALQEIRREAFYNCAGLRSMQVPDNVVQISNYAFAEDWNLASVTFTENSKLPRISYEAFAYCGLTSFRVPANVSTMAQGAFEGCVNLTSFAFAANSRLESISAYLFDGCENLQSIIFENGSALTSIQAHGLEGMRKLTSINFGDAKLTNIDNFAFRFCESLTRFDIPEGVTSLGRYAFYDCIKLSEVTVPASVEHIGRFAFLGAENVNVYFTAETLPAYLQEDWDHGIAGYYLGVTNVITDGDWKYAKLTSGDVAIIEYNGAETELDLTTLDFGGRIVNIGGEAFAYSTLESIVLPETLVTIQNEAFYHSNLKSITIPASVRFIGRASFGDTPIQALTFAGESKLTVMEQSAFEGTKQLQGVTLPKSLTTVGRAIFKNSGISALSFADGIGITQISEEAFAYTNIESVTIPDGVTLLNHNAFRETSQLKTVDFGNADQIMIMSNVFYRSGLETFTIPANVTYIGEYAFVALPNLKDFTVAEDNPNYKTVDGLLVSKNGRKLIAAPAGREGTLTVPAEIEVIGFGAFEGSRLTKIDFLSDANILSFGYRAFYGSAITEMQVPASVVAIDYYAFAMCGNLTKVTFAEENQLRGAYEGAFYGCKNLYDIALPDTVVEISDFAFYGCRKLNRLPVSETSTIKGIYDYAFAYTGLGGDFTTPDTLIDIGAYAFMGNRFTSVTIPDTNAYDLIIGIGAFDGCNAMEEITVPFIGASFEDPDITWFGYIFGAGGYEANATYVPQSLKKVTVAEGISEVGEHAFDGLTMLEEMSIPHSVTLLWPYAFYGTTARYELTNVITPISSYDWTGNYYRCETSVFGTGVSGKLILSVKVESFWGTTGFSHLTDFGFSEDHPNFICVDGIVYNKSITEIVAVPGGKQSAIIPNTVQVVNGFSGCSQLRSVKFHDGVIQIGGFAGCSSLSSITIPSSVIKIDSEAFFGCNTLACVIIAENSHLESIGQYAFNGCDNLKTIYNNSDLIFTIDGRDHGDIAWNATLIVDKNGNKIYRDEMDSTVEYIETEDGFLFTKQEDVYRLISYNGTETVVTLPLTIRGYKYEIFHMQGVSQVIIPEGFTEISDAAFHTNYQLQSVSIPSTVTRIGAFAFQAFSSAYGKTSALEHITFAPNSQLKEIGRSAFSHCSKLKNMAIPATLETIGEDAFYGCSFETIEFDERNTHFVQVGSGVYNASITKLITYCGQQITIPNTVVDLGNGFAESSTIEYIDFESGSCLTEIKQGAFTDCYSLQKIIIPSSVTKINYSAFSGASQLEVVLFEENSCLQTIWSNAFTGCGKLKYLILPNSNVWIDDYAFTYTILLCEAEDQETPTRDLSLPANTVAYNRLLLNESHELYISDELYFYIDEFVFQHSASGLLLTHCFEINHKENLRLPELILPYRIEQDVFAECYKLKNITLRNDQKALLQNCTNLETLVITGMPTHSIAEYFGYHVPMTLKSIVLTDGVRMNSDAFSGITGITIYVEASEKDVKWDENYPNWHNGNKVVYGDQWITADFYDPNGNLISSEIFLTSQVIRQPHVELARGEQYSEVLVGWDLNGDGIADTVPSTSTVDLVARPIVEKRLTTYTVTFYAEDGKTEISRAELPYGSLIVLPELAEKMGYTVNGWKGYTEGMAVSGDCYFVLDRVHNGDGHSYTAPVWIEPTCEEQGCNKHVCTVCGEWYATDFVDALGHSYETLTTDATCTESGTVIHTCAVCGDSYTEEIPAHGHSYTVRTVQEATCTKQGELLYTCGDCGDEQTEQTALKAHNYQKKYASKWWLQWLIEHILNIFFGYEGLNPYYFECADCRHIQTVEEMNLSSSASVKEVCDHNLGDWTKIADASCVALETEGRICSICNKVVEARTIGELTGIHSFGNWYQTKAPTCAATGTDERECKVCHTKETRTVDALGHTNAEAVVENKIEATCTEDGRYDSVIYCSLCKAEIRREEKVIDKLGHEYESDWTVDVEPTCTEKGSKSHHCTRCNDKADVTEVAAFGHSFGSWITHNETRHKHVCFCGEEELSEHIYDNETDASCNDCGATREIVTETTDNGNGNTNSDSEKSGCGATVSSGFVMILLIVGMGFAVLRKRKI